MSYCCVVVAEFGQFLVIFKLGKGVVVVVVVSPGVSVALLVLITTSFNVNLVPPLAIDSNINLFPFPSIISILFNTLAFDFFKSVNLIIRRASSKDNFTIWNDIYITPLKIIE